MTEVAFHFNAPDRLGYACRLVRKAVASGAKVVITGEAGTLKELDTALWTFAALEFIPHSMVTGSESVVTASPVVLAETVQKTPHRQVLLNLGGDVPEGFERFERLIEVVVQDDEADRQHARRRWKHYADRGYAITRHDLAQKVAQKVAN